MLLLAGLNLRKRYVPDEQGVSGKGDKGFTESVGERRHEQEDGHDHRSHRLGGLGEGILESYDVCDQST